MDSKLEKRLVPVDLLFTQDNLAGSDNEFYEELSAWHNVPLVNLEPVIRALEEYTRSGKLPPDYLEYEKMLHHPRQVNGHALEIELKQLTSTWRKMLPKRHPVVGRMENDHLVLQSGNTPAALAKIRGDSWINVLMPDAVARQWDARSANDLDREVEKQSRKSFYTPVMHEKFRKWPVSRKGVRRLDMMRRFLGPVHRQLSVLDIGCNIGYYCYHFCRQGFDVTGIDISENHMAIARAQQSMYSAPVRLELRNLNEFVAPGQFDIVLGLTVFYHMLGFGQMPQAISPEELGRKLDELVGTALFWESGDDPQMEIELIATHSRLKHYTKLGETSATSIDNREFGVFTRVPVEEARCRFHADA